MGEKFTQTIQEKPATQLGSANRYEPTGGSFSARFSGLPEPTNETFFDTQDTPLSKQLNRENVSSRLYVLASKGKVTREIISTLNQDELLFLLDKASFSSSWNKRDALQEYIPSIIKVLWEKSNLSFSQKLLIINELQDCVTVVSRNEAYEAEYNDHTRALEIIGETEKNFFLQSNVKSYLTEGRPDYSLKQRREMIQNNWDNVREIKDGVTHFMNGRTVILSIPQEVRSVSELTEDQVYEITGWWIRDDRAWLSHHQEQEDAYGNKILDRTLNNIATTYQLNALPRRDIRQTDDVLYAFQRFSHTISLSSISPEFGAVYDGNSLQEVFPKSEADNSQIPFNSIGKKINNFLFSLKDSSEQILMNLMGEPDLHKEFEEIRPYLEEDPHLVDMIMRYIEEWQTIRRNDQENPHDPKSSDMHTPSSNTARNLLDEISWRTIDLFRGKISASAIKSVPLDEFIKNQSLDTTDSDTLPQLYKSFASTRMRVFLEDYFGFSFSEIPLRSQLQFLKYVWDKDEETVAQVQQFIQQAKNSTAKSSRFISFLSLEQSGPEMGEKILAIGQHLPIEIADSVFQKYTEITTSLDQADGMLRSLTKNLHDTTLLVQIQESLIKKANLLLVDSYKVLRGFDIQERMILLGVNPYGEPDGYFNLDDWEKIFEKWKLEEIDKLRVGLGQINADLLLFLSTFKTLRENGEPVGLEDFQNSRFPSIPGSEIPPEETKLMRSLYADSMQGYSEETREELLANFDEHLEDEKSSFSLLRYKNEIAGFLCFTEVKPGQKYVSAVTLDPRFQKAYIGEAMIDEAFKREAAENILGADCVAQKSVSARYIENGFVGVRSWDDRGDLILDIVRDDRRNEQYFSTKSLSQEEIVRLAPLRKYNQAKIEIVTDPKEHAFELCNKGFVLTRYFKDAQTKKWYLVYEPRPSKVSSEDEVGSTEEKVTV